jgi:hypothetical protein
MENDMNVARYTWAKNLSKDFLLTAKELTIFLKDGYGFFLANEQNLKERFADPNKKTNIIIVHPDSPLMHSVAAMDPKKSPDFVQDPFAAPDPTVQRKDCLQAVRILQKIKQDLLDTGVDIADRVSFIGQMLPPTWNGFIGDDCAIVNFYTARPYRGVLVASEVSAGNIKYEECLTDCRDITREMSKHPRANLWKYPLQNG